MAVLFMLFWLILNGRLESDVFITGGCVTLVMMVAVCLWGGWNLKKEIKSYLLIPRGIIYFGSLVAEIVKANLSVIKIIFGKGELSPCVRILRTELKTPAARMMLANSITLTPGTVTIQLSENVLTVNCLNDEMAGGIDGWVLEKQLLKMESSMIKASEMTGNAEQEKEKK